MFFSELVNQDWSTSELSKWHNWLTSQLVDGRTGQNYQITITIYLPKSGGAGGDSPTDYQTTSLKAGVQGAAVPESNSKKCYSPKLNANL